MTAHEQSITDLVKRWFEEVWNQGRVETIDEIMHPDCPMHGITPTPLRGPAEFRAYHAALRAAFPDVHITLEDIVAQGDKVAVRCTVTATHQGQLLSAAPTGNAVTFTGMGFAKFENGQMVEGWNNFDFMVMYQQVGMLATI